MFPLVPSPKANKADEKLMGSRVIASTRTLNLDTISPPKMASVKLQANLDFQPVLVVVEVIHKFCFMHAPFTLCRTRGSISNIHLLL